MSDIKGSDRPASGRKQTENKNKTVSKRAAQCAMFTGAVAGIQQTAPALAQTTGDSSLNEIIVTGSRIRRVDAETASPVQIITAEAIQQTGVATIGELMTKLPAISGAATNPAVNNGGGDGATTVELRGLDAKRTLVLIDGHRFGIVSQLWNAIDVGAIPINMIERVEVLKQGAGAVYGSDAIGGVVNFITKKSMDGAEASLDYGKSSKNDGERKGVSLSWGTSSDTGNLIVGFNYNKQDEISAGDRDFSKNAIYFYGSVFEAGSSRTPRGRLFLDGAGAADDALQAQFGCNSITRIPGTTGATLADYRCYVSTGTPNDSYNFQPLNLIMTPQERASVFALGTHKISDDVEMYVQFLYNRTTSGFDIAPLPFDARSDNTVISADNMYNPFGISFGGAEPDPITGALNPNASYRLEALGNRDNRTQTWQGQIFGGLRGKLFQTDWNWDASGGYSRVDQDRSFGGYPFKSAFANALGPSFDDDGTPTCGTPTAPIAGCIPLNIFNLADPAQVPALKSILATTTSQYMFSMTQANLALDGPVFSLPAGEVRAAVGANYSEFHGDFDTDYITQAPPPLFKECYVSSDQCSNDTEGKYDVTEFYGELYVPVLKDAPFAKSLDLTAGVRYSDYSTFGSTTNYSFKVDWRPISDLMLRASYADVFRAPTIDEMFQGPASDAPTFTDPCVGLTSAQLADTSQHYAALCQNVAPDTNFDQPNSQVDGLLLGGNVLGGKGLDPEEGDAWTAGFVIEPAALRGFSFSADYWSYSIDHIITQIDPNTSAKLCLATGDPTYCGLFNRYPDGTIRQVREPTTNLGKLETSGWDFNVTYLLPELDIGQFRIQVDATHTDKYDSKIPGYPVIRVAGTYDKQYGNYAEWRGTTQVGWTRGGWDAQLYWRYIDSIVLHDPDSAPGPSPDLQIASQSYWDMTVGYTFDSTGTRLQVGVNNMFDNQPPIMYINNVLNANTDVNTYDTIGRYFFGSITQKF